MPMQVFLFPFLLHLSYLIFSSAYTLSPPTIPPRDHLLVRDPITAIARPLPETRWSAPYLDYHLSDMITGLLSFSYIAVLFALTFTHVLVV